MLELETNPLIHPTAIVDPSARLEAGVKIGPWCIVEADTQIGAGTVLESGAQVLRFTRLGARNRIGRYVILGGEPMDLKFTGDESYLQIGSENDIREFTTIHRATTPGGFTKIGSGNLVMAYCHITHDCVVGDRNIIANAAQIAGHVVIEDHVRFGATVGVHQFCRIGAHSIVGMMSKVTQDILPFTLSDGHPAKHFTINKVGLERDGYSREQQRIILAAFKAVRNKDEAAMRELEAHPEAARLFAAARQPSNRGLSSFA